MTDDKADILRLLRDQEAATARGDAAGTVAPIADDAVAYDLPPPLEFRGDAARDAEAIDGWFSTWENGVTVELKDPDVLIDGDLAVVFGLSRMRGTKKGAGPLDQWSRRTVVLRRQGAAWRIVHAHSSFPMKMDGSNAAATDLKP